MKVRRRGFRLYFYLQTGYSTYLMLLIGAVNVLTSTYFLAIDSVPFVKELFPTFEIYVLVAVVVALPVVTITGYIHFKRIGAHSASSAISHQNFIYNYRFPPGFNIEVFAPAYQAIMTLTLKRACSEKFTDEDKEKIDELRSKLKHLMDGGAVGTYARGVIDN